VAVPAGFTHDVMSVCRKDSQELTVEDRQALVETIRRVPNSSKFIVTHGSDTMIETAQYVAAAKGGVGH
jgi:L-asparaginase